MEDDPVSIHSKQLKAKYDHDKAAEGYGLDLSSTCDNCFHYKVSGSCTGKQDYQNCCLSWISEEGDNNTICPFNTQEKIHEEIVQKCTLKIFTEERGGGGYWDYSSGVGRSSGGSHTSIIFGLCTPESCKFKKFIEVCLENMREKI